MTKLTEKHCVPCEGGTPPLDEPTTRLLMGGVRGLAQGRRAERRPHAGGAQVRDFVAAMAFLDKLAVIAEAEGPTIRTSASTTTSST